MVNIINELIADPNISARDSYSFLMFFCGKASSGQKIVSPV